MRPPQPYFSLITKGQLAEMMSASYAKARTIDPNEAYLRLEVGLRTLPLIEGLQDSLWHALLNERPDLEESKLVALIRKKLQKRKRYRAAGWSRSDEGAWVALSLFFDQQAGVGSGEAEALLETPDGQTILDRGFELAGKHLAKELLR